MAPRTWPALHRLVGLGARPCIMWPPNLQWANSGSFLVSESQRATSALQASACVTCASVLFTSASHMGVPRVRGRGNHQRSRGEGGDDVWPLSPLTVGGDYGGRGL